LIDSPCHPAALAGAPATQAAVFDQPVHIVENAGNLLHLVEDDRRVQRLGGAGQELFPEQGRSSAE
jgi:hypothetical protein